VRLGGALQQVQLLAALRCCQRRLRCCLGGCQRRLLLCLHRLQLPVLR
jgi:hypothetical protein